MDGDNFRQVPDIMAHNLQTVMASINRCRKCREFSSVPNSNFGMCARTTTLTNVNDTCDKFKEVKNVR